MGFDEEDHDKDKDKDKDKNNEEKQPIQVFGIELSSGVVYIALGILGLIFARQAFIVFQALN